MSSSRLTEIACDIGMAHGLQRGHSDSLEEREGVGRAALPACSDQQEGAQADKVTFREALIMLQAQATAQWVCQIMGHRQTTDCFNAAHEESAAQARLQLSCTVVPSTGFGGGNGHKVINKSKLAMHCQLNA